MRASKVIDGLAGEDSVTAVVRAIGLLDAFRLDDDCLSLAEAPQHPHNVARKTFVEIDGVTQPAPAPRFSRTGPDAQGVAQIDNEAALAGWGFSGGEIESLRAAGAI